MALSLGCHIGYDDHQTGVERLLLVKREEIKSIVGNECVVTLDYDLHQFPVFGTTLTEVIHMLGDLATAMG